MHQGYINLSVDDIGRYLYIGAARYGGMRYWYERLYAWGIDKVTWGNWILGLAFILDVIAWVFRRIDAAVSRLPFEWVEEGFLAEWGDWRQSDDE